MHRDLKWDGWKTLVILLMLIMAITTWTAVDNHYKLRILRQEFSEWTEQTARMPGMIGGNAAAIGRLANGVEGLARVVEVNADRTNLWIGKMGEQIYKIWRGIAFYHGEWVE